ncbi:hypothetical protein J5N97_024080 [Dioscorea zingiberensis]|uniref:NAC domain-containing protein n=1 Tax=Dioscorea zingiberensis TaxID=325984 RepID=A0A9D5C6D7_9LILI|nr:hypothetical protein J5N97_024080 [Dioscorea zingiberensis]
MRLPRGCRFDPNEFELIQYLSDKVAGCPDPGQGLIKEDVDVYGISPDLLPVDLMASGGDGRLFCFAPIKFRKGPSCRDRSTPDGHWKATNARSSIKDEEGDPIGFTQTFSYYHGKNGAARTKWIMKEYTLFADVPQNVALCVIYSTLNKYKYNKPRDSFLNPIPKKSSLSYNASSKDDGSNLKSSQGSPSTDQISMSYSNDVGGCSGSVSIIGTGNGFMDGPPWSEPSWKELLSFNEEDILSVAELACLPDNGCPDGANIQSDVLKAKDVAGLNNLSEFLLEEVDSPKLALEL